MTADCLPSTLIIILLPGCLIITGNNPCSSDSALTINLDCLNLPLYSDSIVTFLFFAICPIWFFNIRPLAKVVIASSSDLPVQRLS